MTCRDVALAFFIAWALLLLALVWSWHQPSPVAVTPAALSAISSNGGSDGPWL